MLVILRVPSLRRSWWTIRSTAEAICSRIARSGQLDAGHEDHRLESGEHVARRVGVAGRHRAVVAGVHGLEHVERLTAAALADDDAIGPHAQGVAHQLADGDRALAFDVRRPRLERDDVLLAQLQLGRVLDRDDALVVGDERRQDVEQRRLAGAGAAGDDDVQARLDARAQEVDHLGRRGPEADQVVRRHRRGRELADGDHGPDERDGRDDDVDARAVDEAGVDHRRRLVDAPADRRDDALDDAHHVIVVLERHVGQLDLAAALDVHLARAVDHHLSDRLVAQQRLQRAEADDLVGDLLEHAGPLGAGQRQAFRVERAAEGLLDLAPHLDLVGQVELRVEVLDDALLDAELGVAERLAQRHLGQHPASGYIAAAGGGLLRQRGKVLGRWLGPAVTRGSAVVGRRRDGRGQARNGGCGHAGQL